MTSKCHNVGRGIRLFGKRISKEELHDYVKRLIDNEEITETCKLSKRIGKQPRQTRRILIEMESKGLIEFNQRGRLLKTLEKRQKEEYDILTKNKFANIPEIQKWINDCILRDVDMGNMHQMVNKIKSVCDTLKVTPAQITISKRVAVEIWKNYMIHFKSIHPNKTTGSRRSAMRNFLSSHDIIFAFGMGKQYGLGSEHDRYAVHAGVCLDIDSIEKMGSLMLHEKDFESYVWFRIGLRTGARSGAISSMTWDRINLDKNNFWLEQFETKTKRGQKHLEQKGKWMKKYPPEDLRQVLLLWKSIKKNNSRFVWFENQKTDLDSLRELTRIRNKIIPKLKEYFSRIESNVDPNTKEYAQNMFGHLLRHTFAQLLKNSGVSSEMIANAGGWDSTQIVDTWYTTISEEQQRKMKQDLENIECTSNIEKEKIKNQIELTVNKSNRPKHVITN